MVLESMPEVLERRERERGPCSSGVLSKIQILGGGKLSMHSFNLNLYFY